MGSNVTLLERKTRFYLIKQVTSKSAKDSTHATIELLEPFKEYVYAIGREFAYHAEIAQTLEAKVKFAHPHSSWERGANENSNDFLRQYVPKGINLRVVTGERINFAMGRINYRPRKCLGF
jgi:IS30 family transposase